MAKSQTDDFPGPLLHPAVIGLGSTLLAGAVVTDVMYYQTSLVQWANFSAWLIAAGLVVALVAAISLAVDLLIGRARRIAWLPFMVVAATAVLSLVNVFVHTRDAWTSVVPQGLALSLVVAVLALVSAVGGCRVTTTRGADRGDRA